MLFLRNLRSASSSVRPLLTPLLVAASVALSGCAGSTYAERQARIQQIALDSQIDEDDRVAAGEEAKSDEEIYLCETIYVTGSHIGQRVCISRAERKRQAEANQQALRDRVEADFGKSCLASTGVC